jgi:hypothetical protein
MNLCGSEVEPTSRSKAGGLLLNITLHCHVSSALRKTAASCSVESRDPASSIQIGLAGAALGAVDRKTDADLALASRISHRIRRTMSQISYLAPAKSCGSGRIEQPAVSTKIRQLTTSLRTDGHATSSCNIKRTPGNASLPGSICVGRRAPRHGRIALETVFRNEGLRYLRQK